MIERKAYKNRDEYINNMIKSHIELVQMEVVEINEDDLSATLKYGENRYFNNCSLRGLNIETEDEDIYNVEIPELESKVWALLSQNQAVIIKCFRPEKIITQINKTKIEIIDKSAILNCGDIEIEIDGENNKVNIISDKLYLNSDTEEEPLVRGNKLKEHIEKLYDYINDLYTKFLAHMHLGNMGAPTPLSPPELTTIPPKQIELASDKATTSQTLSTKNYTE